VLDVRRHDLRVDPVLVAPVVVANLLRPLLLAWAGRLAGGGGGRDGGGGGGGDGGGGGGGGARGADFELPERVIASGLLVDEADEVAGAFAAAGLREAARPSSGDWAALLLERHP
jgi:hypothetical protein